jgi:DNA-binding beta-propeller fold protein YncE
MGHLTLAALATVLAMQAGGDVTSPATASVSAAATHSSHLAMPQFRYETDWLKLPAGLTMGEVVAVAVDAHDHVWVLHRPRSVTDRPASEVAPPIAEFDRQGRYLRGFGGPAEGYEWPGKEHTLALAANGEIWITGNMREAEQGDDMLLVFDRHGRFLRQYGRRGANQGNFDRVNFNAPADVYVDDRAQEVYVADGYGNQRVIVLDERNGRFRRMWGAFGRPPPASESIVGPATFNGVHGVEIARDGTVYVSDRGNQRIQAFTKTGRYLGQTDINRGLSAPLTASGITFSRDPAQKYLFVADWGNGMIVVLDRKAMRVIGTIGHQGTAPGEFKGPHLIDVDSKGVIYIAEVQGRRLQRLVPIDQ